MNFSSPVLLALAGSIGLIGSSCSVVPKNAPALETLEKWQAASASVPASAPKAPFNATAGTVNARISSLQQSITDVEPWLVTTADLSAQRLADIQPAVESYLQSAAPVTPRDATAAAAGQALAQWLLEYAKAARKESAEAARKRLEGYRWKTR